MAVKVLRVVVLTMVAGCSAPLPTFEPPAEPTVFDALADPASIPAKARAELGEQVVVRRVTLSETGFSMEVRDPVKPDNIDRYAYYNGRWTHEPVSVSVSDIESFDVTTFGIGTINWKVIPDLQRQALAGLDLEDEHVTSVSVDRIEGDPPRIYVGVTGSRGNGSLIADGQGRGVVVRRN